LPVWEVAFARDIDHELPLALLASCHSFKRVNVEELGPLGAPVTGIVSFGTETEREFKRYDIFIALTIVADYFCCGCLTRVVLILFKEDLGAHWLRAKEATATTNLTIHVES